MKLFIIILSLCGYVFCAHPTVNVEQGEITGTLYTVPNGRVINAFLGIPYAKAPVGEYRFKEPQVLKSWIGSWNASSLSSSCLQYNHASYEIIGEEDCLYLNVFTPKLPEKGASQLLDVIFYIHGGAFMFGTGGTVYPDYIMQEHDLVYVSINYRLGTLGFLSTGDSVVPGNNGLKDQVAALKWVHRNIIQFGGNPASVTIVGSSAGGASVHYHFLSSMSDGLFQKGISFSGSVLPPWTMPRNNIDKSIHLASLVGCPTVSTRDMVKCMRNRPAKQIVEAAKYFQTWRYSPFTPFGPVVEPTDVSKTFLNEDPLQLLYSGKVKDLPWMISFCKHEGLYPAADFIADENSLRELNEKWNEIAPNLLMYNYSISSEMEKNSVSEAVRKFYFDDKAISKEVIPEIIQALGDRAFYNDITRAAKLHSSVTTQNVFCYFFGYRGKYSLSNKYTKNFADYGVSHADDLSYIVKYFSSDSQETVADAAMIKFMTSIVYSFIKTGDPRSANLQWEPLSKNKTDNLKCLYIQSPEVQEMREFSNKLTLEFWKNILPSEYASESPAVLKDEF